MASASTNSYSNLDSNFRFLLSHTDTPPIRLGGMAQYANSIIIPPLRTVNKSKGGD